MDHNTPPFWHQFGFFFKYLKQEQLYYQITLLALANLLLLIPVIIVTLLVAGVLFLMSYKLAFEVLHTVSSGQMEYGDGRAYEIDTTIGFKAIAMAVLQLAIYLFVFRYDPPVGMALLILTTVVTPAYLMVLCKTQDLLAAFNPVNLTTVMGRIGFEYAMLLVFFLLCGAVNLLFRYFMAQWLPGVVGDVITAWVLYFLLVFTFLVIGYVMYRHADELGHETVDTEVVEDQTTHPEDPIKDRIIDLLEHGQPQEALDIINEIKAESDRHDLDPYLAQAHSMLVQKARRRPAEQLQDLVDEQQFKAAIEMYFSYAEDGHLLKPKTALTITQMIEYAYNKNQYNVVIKLCRDFDKRYPLEHEQIVSNFFLVAKIQYQNKRIDQAKTLLQSLIKRYQNTANTQGLSSYLKGIEKLNRE